MVYLRSCELRSLDQQDHRLSFLYASVTAYVCMYSCIYTDRVASNIEAMTVVLEQEFLDCICLYVNIYVHVYISMIMLNLTLYMPTCEYLFTCLYVYAYVECVYIHIPSRPAMDQAPKP